MQPIDVMKKAKKYNLEVEFVTHGIASRIGDTIIMNIKLPQYDKFCKGVLDHEIRHSGKMTKKDLAMDMFEGSIYENMKFSLRHPSAFSQFIPVGKWKGEWFIDANMIIIYFIVAIVIGGYFSING